VEHLAQVEVAVAGVGVIIDLVEVVEDTTVAVVIMVLEVVVSTEMVETIILVGVVVEAGVEEATIEVVAVTVVLMTTVVAEVAAMGDEIRRTKGVVKVATVLVAMGKLLHKLLLRMVVLRVIMQHLRAPMEATMLMVQILQCRLLIATVVAQAHTHQAMVPRLHTNMVVPQGGKGVCLLHMMVDMVVGPCLGVEDLGVHHRLIMVAAAVILVVLTLNQLEKLSSAMKIVTRHVTTQGFTSQICLLMSLLRNYKSYLEESARYNLILHRFLLSDSNCMLYKIIVFSNGIYFIFLQQNSLLFFTTLLIRFVLL
jgi:hypothetical protein